ncbi:MAG TPA: hypothetical protein VHI73_06470 [Solirubrobacteraceae bacterium]|nr:hypothetical protein [Solirubrobacteraceae bacterium]
MRVLILLGHGDLGCRVESVVAALDARGHRVEVTAPDAAAQRPGGPTARRLPGGGSVAAAYRRLRVRLPAARRPLHELRVREPEVVVGCLLVDRYIQAGLHAATRLGLPTAALATWEDGPTAGTLSTLPDSVLAWNSRVAREARRAHAVPRDRLLVTGAAAFDGWFERRGASGRAEVCTGLGVDPRRPYVLHAGPTPDRAHGERLRRALDADGRTRGLAVAVGPAAANDSEGLFDAVSHAAAIAGADPWAFVAAAIADRPCVLLAAERRGTDERVRARLEHLVEGRFVEVVADPAAAATAVGDLVEGRDPRAPMRRRLLTTFLRPVSLDRPAGEVVADAILQTAARGARPAEPVLPSRRAALPGRAKIGKARQPPTEEEERRALMRVHDQHLIPVRQPLVLVAQLGASAGDHLVRLLDGHPQLHPKAGRLRPGGDPPAWPRLDLRAPPEAWWEALREPPDGTGPASARQRPFLLSPTLQRRVFDHCVRSWPMERQRDVLDAWLTAYFNAWLDYQNLHAGDQRWVCASGGALGLDPGDRAGFFADYPEGRLIAVVEPPAGGDDAGARQWADRARALLRARSDRGDRLRVVDGAAVAAEPGPVMRGIASWLGIDFDPVLCRATFNRMAVEAPAAPSRAGVDGRAGELYEQLISATG